MRPALLVRLYPARWRRRYGDELEALLEQESASPRIVLDVLAGALAAYLTPFPKLEAEAMPSRRVETAAGLLAALFALPPVVLLAAAAVRNMQPAQREPARTAQAIVDWWAGAHLRLAVVLVLPVVALLLGAAALWHRYAGDPELRADLRVLADVGIRLLRRPAIVASALAVVASLAVLVLAVDHLIVG